jgi:hypothetical protein
VSKLRSIVELRAFNEVFILEALPEKSSDALFKEMLPHVGINS